MKAKPPKKVQEIELETESSESGTLIHKFSMRDPDDFFKEVLVPLRSWYFNNGIFRGEEYTKNEILDMLDITEKEYDVIIPRIKKMYEFDADNLGRAKFIKAKLETINGRIETRLQNIALLLDKKLTELSSKIFDDSESEKFAYETLDRLVNMVSGLESREMEILKFLLGPMNLNNPVYQAMNNLNGDNAPLTRDQLLEAIDAGISEATQNNTLPHESGSLNLTYKNFMKMKEDGEDFEDLDKVIEIDGDSDE